MLAMMRIATKSQERMGSILDKVLDILDKESLDERDFIENAKNINSIFVNIIYYP
jgi:hypothetical protein